jgi:ribonucleoside-diphosphate reductase alpha chain
MAMVAPISQQIWDMKYRFKGPDGAAIDQTIEDTWARVARTLAAVEKDPVQWEPVFREALADFRFLPAGRIVAGAGTGRKVTLFNCFVMGTVPDDMGGIFEHLREAALTMQQGGGIGYDFSTLRPRGAPVKGVGADASGPLTFMDVWDAMCRTIMSAGHRRGAMMATLRCDHPDVEAFIEAKQEPGRLRMFNLSVLVTDAFMDAVKANAPWDLVFNGSVFKTVQARALWDKIMRATYAYAEPGVIFIDRINRRNNLHYCETIAATNPCVTSDTWVQTAEGPRQVGELIGKPFGALVNGVHHASGPQGFFATGRKPVLRLTTQEGYSLRLTADHPVRTVTDMTRWRIESEWRKAGELKAGDRIVLNDHRTASEWQGEFSDPEGYLLGLLVGDGTLKTDKAVISVSQQAQAVNCGAIGHNTVMDAALAAARTLPHRSDFVGWIEVPGRNEWRLASGAVKTLALDVGMTPGDKRITPRMERASSAFTRGFLRGFFDADGSVQGSQAKGVSVRLAQSDLARLEAVQRMLLRLGIASTTYRNRRDAGSSTLPDGRGGERAYATQPQHELVVTNENAVRFAELVGFADDAKSRWLDHLIRSYRRTPNRERFVAEVESLLPDGEEEVFDVQVPGVNAFDANGLLVHNCGEQPLPPYGACLLGSVNLAQLVQRPFEADAVLDEAALDTLVATAIRMMDNTIDVSNFPLPQQTHEAQAKRRIGLGVTGLADALIMCGARYGSAAAVQLTERWMKRLQRAAYLASIGIAKEKGPFPLFERDAYLAGESIRELDDDVRAGIAQHGIRNALLTSIAPTGTISLFADNISSGLEPVFSFAYTRNVLMPDGTRREEEVSDHAYRLFRRLKGETAPLTDAFVDAQILTPADHVRMQAAVQKYVDSSISKTINCPEDISFEAFRDIYLMAYDLGCKGCTTYRPNDVTGSVLQVKKEKPVAQAQPELPLAVPAAPAKPKDMFEAGGVVYMTRPLDRPEALPGRTYKVHWPESEHAIYITINDIVKDGRVRPFEMFINSKNMEHFAWTVALTRMISAVFRRGGDVSFVVEELKAVFDPRGGHWMGGRYVPSLLAAIGEVIERHMIAIGFIADPKRNLTADPLSLPKLAVQGGDLGEAMEPAPMRPSGAFRQCPKCGEAALTKLEGCDTCTSCGYSKCG